MYTPHKYRNEDLPQLREFIRANSFGILINLVDGRPWATHIPLELTEEASGAYCLRGHVARANPQWRSFGEPGEVLCIFTGPHAYISSSWYKEEEVPTWNYIAVHIYGSLRVLDETELLASLDELVDKYESASENPVSLHELSPSTMKQIRGIVGFEIRIGEVQATYKLSQGREEDHPRITEELRARGDSGSLGICRHMDAGKS